MHRTTILPIVLIAAAIGLLSLKSQDFDLKKSIVRGQDIYSMQCLSCHMDNGEGLEGVYPPLAKSDYLMADKARSIREILHGVSGEIMVNGKTYNGFMTGFDLTDEQVADVLNYIRNTWGNSGEVVTPGEVANVRKDH